MRHVIYTFTTEASRYADFTRPLAASLKPTQMLSLQLHFCYSGKQQIGELDPLETYYHGQVADACIKAELVIFARGYSIGEYMYLSL